MHKRRYYQNFDQKFSEKPWLRNQDPDLVNWMADCRRGGDSFKWCYWKLIDGDEAVSGWE